MGSNKSCQPERLRQLLHEELPAVVEQAICDHVSACDNCQRELESLAANDGWWSETSDRLSRSSLDDSFSGAFSASAIDEDLAQFSSDFAVDFLEPSDDPNMMGRLGDYEIVAVIGRGGMGIVLKGFQRELHRHVAVKVLSPHLATSGAARRRFAREAQATAAVVHPHVMAIYSVNPNAKLPYLVMAYIDCESLQQRLSKIGPLPVSDVLRIGMQAALGLAAAHAQGIIHRDVKPANILLETNVDRVLLTDFGLARAVDDATLTRTGIIAGTPQYMSPEQANGDALDPRSDLFSLGGVLYAMCTGRPPFRAETTFGVLRRIRELPPRSIREINPEIPEWLERIVLRLLEKQPAYRPDSALAVATLLEQCLAHVQQPTLVGLPGELQTVAVAKVNQQATRLFIAPVQIAVVFAGLMSLVAIGNLLVRRPSEEAPRRTPQDTAKTGSNAKQAVDQQIEPIAESDVPLDWEATEQQLNGVENSIEPLATDIELFDFERMNTTNSDARDDE